MASGGGQGRCEVNEGTRRPNWLVFGLAVIGMAGLVVSLLYFISTKPARPNPPPPLLNTATIAPWMLRPENVIQTGLPLPDAEPTPSKGLQSKRPKSTTLDPDWGWYCAVQITSRPNSVRRMPAVDWAQEGRYELVCFCRYYLFDGRIATEPVLVIPMVGDKPAFSAATRYMSPVGYARWRYWQNNGEWMAR